MTFSPASKRPPSLPTRTARRIVFIKRVVCDYQVPFLLQLQQRLAARNASLTLLAGLPEAHEGLTDSLGDLPFGIRIATRRIAWQAYASFGVRPRLQGASLILIEQANSQLVNYPILIGRLLGRPPPVAMVGHGGHFNRAMPAPFRDAWRAFWLRRTDWFFAYTAFAATRVVQAGFPPDRVTVFQNTVDTKALTEAARRQTEDELGRTRFELFAERQIKPTGVFCGRLVKEKEIPFMLETLDLIHDRLSDFRMIMIGDGSERTRVERFCQSRPWCRWVGRKNGLERASYFKLAQVFIHPAPIGLAILDAFAVGLPLVSTDNNRHGPEIAYLTPGVNGVLCPTKPSAVADAVAGLFADPERLTAMGQAAGKEARLRTVERMSTLFANGIFDCLDRTDPTL